MWRRLAGLLALLPGLWLASAQALGLGDIELRSRLNQRLTANVPVLGAEPSEIESLVVRLASPEDFARAGIERAEFLSSLEFTLAPTGDSVRVSSRQTVRDPLLNFIVEARWNGGRVLREYTVLLDPPIDAARDAAPAVPSRAETAAASPAAAKPATAAAGHAAPGASYGPVLPSETLWSIATKLRPSAAITMDQVLLAIYRANPQAFEGGINGLLKGSRLRVPTAEDMTRADAVGARAEVAALRAQPAPAARPTAAIATKPAAPVAAAPAASPAKRPEPSPEAARPTAVPEPAPAAPPAAAREPAPAPASAAPETPAKTAAAAPAPEAGAPAAHAETPIQPEPAGHAEPAAAEGTAAAEPVAAPATEAPAERAAETVTAAPAAPVVAPGAAPSAADDLLQTLQWPLLAAAVALLGGLLLLRRMRAARAAALAPVPSEPPRAPAAAIDVLLADSRPVPEVPAARAEPKLEPAPAAEPVVADPVAAEAASPAPEAPAAVTIEPPPAVIEPPAPPSPPPIAMSPPPVIEEAQVIEAAPLPPAAEASDPLTEADFHIAYGLYDEAAQMLREAAEAEPQRVELRSKLADTYFAAGKAEAFLETASGLRGQVSRGEWQRITDMGRSLCPQAALFADAASPAPEALPAARRDSLDDISLIDFDLDAELADAAPARPAAFDPDPGWDPAAPLSNAGPAPADAAVGDRPDPAPTFEASAGTPVFDLAVSELPRAAPEPIPEPIPEPAADPLPELSLQPLPQSEPWVQPADDTLALQTPAADAPVIEAPPAPVFDDHLTEAAFDIETQMPADTADADGAFAIGDEADTKLDLARAYADMGDEEAARSLLAEVIASGNEHQRREAESLSQRLTG